MAGETNQNAPPEKVESTAEYLTRRAAEEAAKEGRVAPQLSDDQQREPDDQQEDDDGDGDDPGQEPETDEPPDKEADPGEPGEADDGDGEAGDEPGADDDTTSRAVKKRLQRERRKTERILSDKEKVIAELKEQLLKQRTQDAGDKDTKPAPQKSAERKYPQLVEYSNVDAWMEDLRRYNAGEAMLGPGGKAEGADAKDAGAADEGEKAPDKEPSLELGQQQRLQSYFADLRETLDESDEVSDEDMDDFDARMKDSKIPLSEPMLEWLADNDNSPLIVKTFLEKPRESRRIFRLGTGQAQKAALTKLANAAAQKETGSKPRAPNIKPVRGRSGSQATELSEITDYAEYEKQRFKQSKGRASGFLIS